MIPVTRLNGKSFWLNSDLIKSVESTPDTVLTLVGGEKMMVLEKVEELIERILDYRKRIAQEPPRRTLES